MTFEEDFEQMETNQESGHLSQGVNYLGLLAKQLGDLRGITSLAHELIQNADDAKYESGNLSATRITFDFRDDALVVSNDAVFREIDFERMRHVASGSKRSEPGDRTTGAFGVGFTSVYQVTDRPEIHSAGRCWVLRPDEEEGRRIKWRKDPSITKDKGTVFKLPWAFENSRVRQELKVDVVDRNAIDSFVDELKDKLPKALLFLKKIIEIDLYRNGDLARRITISRGNNAHRVSYSGNNQVYQVLEGDFEDKAKVLMNRYPSIETNRSYRVRIAIPDSELSDGLLYATLPTEQATGLPFHIDADFFPASDRKSIAFENSYDYRSEWNRAALRAAASAIGNNLITLRDMFGKDASKFWAILEQLRRVHEEYKGDERKPFGAFWESLLPSLSGSPIVYVDSGRWLRPDEARITRGSAEREAVPAFRALRLEIVHETLRKYQNILTRNDVGVSTLGIADIYTALEMQGLTEGPTAVPRDFQNRNLLKLLWIGIYGVLQNAQRPERLLRSCAIAPGLDGRLWPCGSVYNTDTRTRKIFGDLLPRDRSFLTANEVPLLRRFCPRFTPSIAIEELGRLETWRLRRSWEDGHFDSATLLMWFDNNKRELSESMQENLASLSIFPSAGELCPL